LPWIALFVVIVHRACLPGRARYPARDLIIDICRSPGMAQPFELALHDEIAERGSTSGLEQLISRRLTAKKIL
jgi:hypothetical protein